MPSGPSPPLAALSTKIVLVGSEGTNQKSNTPPGRPFPFPSSALPLVSRMEGTELGRKSSRSSYSPWLRPPKPVPGIVGS